MTKILFLVYLFLGISLVQAQNSSNQSADRVSAAEADDPSRYLTRVELLNELQHFKYFVPLNQNNVYLNETTFRTIVKIGDKFTTRLDIPFLYNSYSSPNGLKQFGISDISFRLLGYKFLDSPKNALTASIEVSLNTANSPLLGTGKNILNPVISYTATLEKGVFLIFIFQEPFSFSGNKARPNISYSELQVAFLYTWSKTLWSYIGPELYIDYVNGGASMNVEARVAFNLRPRINLYAQTGVGVFGDFIERYQWEAEIGCRYFMFRKMHENKN